MLRKALEEILWIIILAVLFGAAFLLAGCLSYEGSGFSNAGAYANQRQCMRINHLGHEVWYSIPASRKCP